MVDKGNGTNDAHQNRGLRRSVAREIGSVDAEALT